MKLETLLQAAVGKEFFFIPKGMVIEGTIGSLVPGLISGTVNGNITLKSKLTLLKEGIVNGNITTGELHVHGTLNGDVIHCEKMVVYSGAKINGHVTAVEIHTEKNASIEGEIIKSRKQGSLPAAHIANTNKETSQEIFPVNINQNNSATPDRQAWF